MAKPMTIYLPSGMTLNVAYDAEVMAFEHEGMEIRHPFLSDCGRFSCDPAYYGFTAWNSGGNTMVLRKDLPSGEYLLLTAEDEGIPDHTDLKEVEKSLLGRYTKGGDCIAYITMEDVPFSCDEE